jgi:hypothetical protein
MPPVGACSAKLRTGLSNGEPKLALGHRRTFAPLTWSPSPGVRRADL